MSKKRQKMLSLMQKLPEQVKLTGDAVSIGGIVSIYAGYITNVFGAIAAIASCAWAIIRLYETQTVQNWLAKRKGS